MDKVFRQRLDNVLTEFMSQKFPSFKKLKSMPRGAGTSILFKELERNKLAKFIQIKFIPDRNYVMCNLQWSKLGRFPDELCVPSEVIRKSYDALEKLDQYDEVWLSSAEFGLSDSIEMALDEPDADFAASIYSVERAKELSEYSADESSDFTLTGFIELARVCGWDILLNCFGRSIISEEHVDKALGDVPSFVIKFISEYATSYFHELDKRLC